MVPVQHFSSEVVERCLYLLETLKPSVEQQPVAKYGGALTTTFLLAMAMPLIVIPVERIADARERFPIGDRGIDHRLTNKIDMVLDTPFATSPLRGTGEWFHFVTRREAMPDEWSGTGIFSPENRAAAEALAAKDVLWGLRHALSHGNVLYLTAGGLATQRAPAEMFAFTWDKRDQPRRRTVVRLLVTHQDNFAQLLCNWANLVANNRGIQQLLKAA